VLVLDERDQVHVVLALDDENALAASLDKPPLAVILPYDSWICVSVELIAATPLAVPLLFFAARNHWTSERKPKTLAYRWRASRAGCS